jgi:hypothetical protein
MGGRQFAAGALLLGASLMTAPGAWAAPGDKVTYTVTSDAPLASVAYSDESGTTQALPNQPANWSLSFTSKDSSGGLLTVAAVPTGQQTSCQISVNGTVKDSKSSTGTGEKGMVQCYT